MACFLRKRLLSAGVRAISVAVTRPAATQPPVFVEPAYHRFFGDKSGKDKNKSVKKGFEECRVKARGPKVDARECVKVKEADKLVTADKLEDGDSNSKKLVTVETKSKKGFWVTMSGLVTVTIFRVEKNLLHILDTIQKIWGLITQVYPITFEGLVNYIYVYFYSWWVYFETLISQMASKITSGVVALLLLVNVMVVMPFLIWLYFKKRLEETEKKKKDDDEEKKD